jgi:hypothetical protein
MKMTTQTLSLLISLAIIVASIVFLVPRIVFPTGPVTLLNQAIVLPNEFTNAQYTLTLNKGEQLNIQLSGNGDLVNLIITQSSSPSNAIVDQEDQTTFTSTWTVPQTGTYIFTVNTPDDSATANLIVTKTSP